METKRYKTKEEFIKATYITCMHCGYNNERARFLKYGRCLNCGKILDERTYFLIKMKELIKNNERKMR